MLKWLSWIVPFWNIVRGLFGKSEPAIIATEAEKAGSATSTAGSLENANVQANKDGAARDRTAAIDWSLRAQPDAPVADTRSPDVKRIEDADPDCRDC